METQQQIVQNAQQQMAEINANTNAGASAQQAQQEQKPIAQYNLVKFNEVVTSTPMNAYLKKVLGERKEAFVTNLVSLVTNDKGLQACRPSSIIYSAVKATAMDLSLEKSIGQAWVIPYKNKGVSVAQFQIGYKGVIQLALRSDEYKIINTTEVKEGEYKGTDRLTGEVKFNWIDDDEKRNALKTIGYVAYLELKNGYRHALYMTYNEMHEHAKTYSQTYKSKYANVRAESMWTKDFDAMALKTVLKLLLSRWGLLTPTIIDALKFDQASFDDEGNAEYVDNSEVPYADVVDDGEGEEVA